MIVLGGFDCTNSLFLSQKDKILYPLSTASIFNSQTTQWHDQPLTGNIPNARTFHTAIKSNVSILFSCACVCITIIKQKKVEYVRYYLWWSRS